MGNIFDSSLYELDTSTAPAAGDLPSFLKPSDFSRSIHPISKQLYYDVARASEGGKKSIVVSQNDTFWHVVDRLDQNKGKLLVTVAVAAAGCAITLGVGPAIGLAGKAISWAAMQIFLALRVRSKRKNIQKFRDGGGTSTKTVQQTIRNSQTGVDQTFDVTVNNETYGEQILDDVRYVIQNSDFTNIHDSFSDLFRDFEKFRKYFSFPKISNETGAGENQYTIKAQFNPGSIRSCQDAIELWELVCRFAERKNKIRAIAMLLDEFFMYVEMALSEYTADSIRMGREAWDAFTNQGKRDPMQVVRDMVDYSGRMKTGAWYKDLFSIGLNVKTFYGAIPMRIKETAYGKRFGDRVFLELLRREDAAAFRNYAGKFYDRALARPSVKLGAKIRGSKYELPLKEKWLKSAAAKGLDAAFAMLDAAFTGYSPVSLGNIVNWEKPALDDVVGTGLDIAIGNLATFFEKAVIDGDKMADIVTNPETFFAQFMTGADGAAFGVDLVVNALADIAFNWWDKRKLELNAQSAAKRLGTIKKFAKDDIEGYVDLIEGWGASFRKANTSGGYEALPAMVECFRHEAAMDGNMARHFFGELTLMFNKMDMLMDSVYKQAAVEINNYIHEHTSAPGSACSGAFRTTICKGACYNSAENGIKRIIATAASSVNMATKLDAKAKTETLRKLQEWESALRTSVTFDEIPCSPLPGPTKPTNTPLSLARSVVKQMGIKL
ncbi:MAG: hypothetical protein U1A78_14405 [Polyangia bacterium]